MDKALRSCGGMATMAPAARIEEHSTNLPRLTAR
jgi:hypothetical protein